MERELVWKQVYRAVRTISKTFSWNHLGPGHPDVHPTWVLLVCWLWACLWREPVSKAIATLRCRKKRRLYGQLGFALPQAIPDNSTLCRRMQRPDFWQMLQAVQHHLIDALLGQKSCHTLLVDSSPLDIPTISHDADARFGHHGHFGYRLHTLVTQDRIIVEAQALPTNAQELAVFPRLVQQASQHGIHCHYLAADIGYDSEPAHRATRQYLGGMLVVPLNARGGTHAFGRTPLRQAMAQRWRTPAVRAARRKRPRIERVYSVLKGSWGIDSLPRHIRGLPRVTRFLMGMTILYHADLLAKRAKYAA